MSFHRYNPVTESDTHDRRREQLLGLRDASDEHLVIDDHIERGVMQRLATVSQVQTASFALPRLVDSGSPVEGTRWESGRQSIQRKVLSLRHTHKTAFNRLVIRQVFYTNNASCEIQSPHSNSTKFHFNTILHYIGKRAFK